MSAVSRRELFTSLFGRAKASRSTSDGPRARAPKRHGDAPDWRDVAPAPWAVGARESKAPKPNPSVVARIDVGRCVSFCAVCQEACPRKGAITFDPRSGGLRVHAERCDGCGACAQACPSPSRAAALLPRS